jgi:LysM domain-containing protein
MSVMNAGKKSKALVRPLRAGNSRAGERPGRIRASEPGAAASRPEKRNVPGVSAPARPDKAVPGRARATGKSPVRPRLWAVPGVSRPAIAGSGGRDPGATSARDTSASAKTGPAETGPAGSGPRMGGGAQPRRSPGAGSIPLVPRPRTAPDDLISPRPTAPRAPTESPGRPRPGGQDQTSSRTRTRLDQQPVRPASAQPGPWRQAGSSRARVVRSASAPSHWPAGRTRRSRLTRRGRRVLWAAVILLLVAVITPLLLAVASGAQASSHGLPPSAVRAGMRQVVVKPGQSLWSVALNAEPKADPRVVIQQIMEFNALGSQVVVPGESLWVPRG